MAACRNAKADKAAWMRSWIPRKLDDFELFQYLRPRRLLITNDSDVEALVFDKKIEIVLNNVGAHKAQELRGSWSR